MPIDFGLTENIVVGPQMIRLIKTMIVVRGQLGLKCSTIMIKASFITFWSSFSMSVGQVIEHKLIFIIFQMLSFDGWNVSLLGAFICPIRSRFR